MWGNIVLSSFIERTKDSFSFANIVIKCLFLCKKGKIGLNIFYEIVNILNPIKLLKSRVSLEFNEK
jgi:hypothetical protein